jgi:hypothetical protein
MLNFSYFYSVNTLPIDDRLPEQIYNNINQFKGFDSGTKSSLSPECGLARGNPEWLRVLDLSS